MKICPKCKSKFSDENAFCPMCGVELASEETNLKIAETVPTNEEIVQTTENVPGTANNGQVPIATQEAAGNTNILPTSLELVFSSSRFRDTIPVVTNISAINNILNIEQHKEFFVKYGSKTASINIYDITDVMVKRTIKFLAIFWLLFGLLFFFAADGMYKLIFAVLVGYNIYNLKSKNLHIYFPNGHIKIPEEETHSKDVDSLMEYIKAYNPDCIRIDFED